MEVSGVPVPDSSGGKDGSQKDGAESSPPNAEAAGVAGVEVSAGGSKKVMGVQGSGCFIVIFVTSSRLMCFFC